METARGATLVQIAHKVKGQEVKIEDIGSAHDDSELQVLIDIARKILPSRMMMRYQKRYYHPECSERSEGSLQCSDWQRVIEKYVTIF